MMPCPCGKSDRARIYCHRPDCGNLAAIPDLPRPDVSVTSRQTEDARAVDVVIARDGKAKTYTGSHPYSPDGAFKEAVDKILSDPFSAEWLPAQKGK